MNDVNTSPRSQRKHILVPGGWDKAITILDDKTIDDSRKASLLHWIMTHTVDEKYDKDMEVPDVGVQEMIFAKYFIAQSMRVYNLYAPENKESAKKRRVTADKISKVGSFLAGYYNNIRQQNIPVNV